MTVTDHGSHIITALESAWADIQQHHPQVPAVVMITGTSAQRGGERWGHHWPERWQLAETRGGGRAPELFIAGELLAKGGRRVMETLLHEATHALAAVQGIKDTSRGGRYHNRRFVELAVELGLTGPAEPSAGRGWSDCVLGETSAAVYASTISALDQAALAHLVDLWTLIDGQEGDPLPGDLNDLGGDEQPEDGTTTTPGKGTSTTKKRRAGQRLAMDCTCEPPRRIQLTPRVVDDGPVLCGLCGEPFTAALAEEE
ncbi:hypothetical protein ACIBHY_53875 [Nonomuraea sp. NPDC050547]|uniref:hypothetical protein n=1 Tax=Nonomuraea sp. NPDC050547 TaxID=3364368 RepID=UPI0037A82E06